MNIFLLDRPLFPASGILISQLNTCLNSGELVPSALKWYFWQPLKMKQDLPSCHLVDVITQLSCIISSAYKGDLQLIHFILMWNIFMETPVVKYIHIKLGSMLATPSLMRGETISEKHLMTLYMTLVFLNILPLMDFNPKFGEIWISTIIFVGIGLITIYLHRADPIKILLKVP